MRIIIFSSHYLPYMGGVENYTQHLSEMLLRDGHDVVLVTSLEMGLPEEEKTKEGMRIYRLPSWGLLKGRYPVLKTRDPRTEAVFKKLSQESFDLCMINTRFYIMTLYGLAFGRANHIHTIVLEHGTSHLSVHVPGVDQLGEQWEHYLTRRGLRYHADYYGVSKAACAWLAHFGIQAKGVLYNAINPEDVEELRQQHAEDYRKTYNIPDADVVIAFTGRMIKEKGVPQLLKAAEQITKERKNVWFFLAGDGKLLKEAEEHTRENDRIFCLGRIDAPHIISLLDAADIFCLPSFSEGFSTSVLEAAACRAYIITTYRGGSRELVCAEKYGKIIPDNRTAYVEQALREAIDHPKERKEAAENCYQRLCSHFTWRQTADAVEKLAQGQKNV